MYFKLDYGYTKLKMIAYLNGKIILKGDRFIILDVGGVGYKVFLSLKSILNLPKEDNIKVFCFLNVKENIMDLYGFFNYEEYEFFKILSGIRGVGPKIALEISSLGSLESIKDKLLDPETREAVFSGVPGLGQKRAMTIILELTGKIKDISKKDSSDEAESGLMALGFSSKQAKEALKGIPKTMLTEERIKESLKILDKR